jgi:hypothetical protein
LTAIRRRSAVNVVGLRRHNVSAESISALHEAHRLIYRAKMTAAHAAKILEPHGHLRAEVKNLFEFIEAQHLGKQGRARERWRKAGASAIGESGLRPAATGLPAPSPAEEHRGPAARPRACRCGRRTGRRRKKRRLSRATLPCGPGRPGRRPLIRSRWASEIALRAA